MSHEQAVKELQYATALDESDAAMRRKYWAVILGLRPFLDGTRWCVLWGPNIQEGITAFGKTPTEAIQAFDGAMTMESGAAVRK
jgi:hypothetical protein